MTCDKQEVDAHPITKHEMAVPRNAYVMMEPRFLKKCLWRRRKKWKFCKMLAFVVWLSETKHSQTDHILVSFYKTNAWNRPEVSNSHGWASNSLSNRTRNTNTNSAVWLVIKQTSSKTQSPLQITLNSLCTPTTKMLIWLCEGNVPLPQRLSDRIVKENTKEWKKIRHDYVVETLDRTSLGDTQLIMLTFAYHFQFCVLQWSKDLMNGQWSFPCFFL